MGKNNRVREFLEWLFKGCQGEIVFSKGNCWFRRSDYKQELVTTLDLVIDVLKSYVDDETLIDLKVRLLGDSVHLEICGYGISIDLYLFGKIPESGISAMIVDYRVFDIAVRESLDLLLHGIRTNRRVLIFPIEKQLLFLYDIDCRRETITKSVSFLTRIWMFFKLLHFFVVSGVSKKNNIEFLSILILYIVASVKESRGIIDIADYIKMFVEDILKVDWKTARRITESLLVKINKINFCGEPRILRDIEEHLYAIKRELEFRLEMYI